MTDDTNAIVFCGSGKPLEEKNYQIPEKLDEHEAIVEISISTVYKTLSTLEDLALAEVDRYVISSEGKKIKMYRSRIGKVEITLDNLEPVLNLYPNTTNPKTNP